MQRARCNELQLHVFLFVHKQYFVFRTSFLPGRGGITKMTNGKLVFSNRSLFACLAFCVLCMLASVMMLMLNTADCIMLLISSDNLKLSFSIFFIQGYKICCTLTCCCYSVFWFFLLPRSCPVSPRLRFGSFAWYLIKIPVALYQQKKVEYVHLALACWRCRWNQMHWFKLQWHFLQIPGILMI